MQYERKQVLGSDAGGKNRQRILDELIQQPGLCFRALLRATGLASGTLRHHLGVLEREGLIIRASRGQEVLHFAETKPPTPDRVRKAVLRDLGEGWRAIFEHVVDHPGQRQKDILSAVPNQSRSTVQHRLKRLVELGLLEKRRVGLQGVTYRPRCVIDATNEPARQPPRPDCMTNP